jgi:CRISPR system Cascade subunit CasC
MLIQIHILQNYAPANLNRDDTGSPKDAIFGGIRRGRISSQCLKRSMRHSSIFDEAFKDDNLLAVRTKLLPDLICEKLLVLGASAEDCQAIKPKVGEIGRESGKGEAAEENDDNESAEPQEENAVETKQLIFIAGNELIPLAEKLLAIYRRMTPKEWNRIKVKDLVKDLTPVMPRSVDVAMFGRMTTSAAFEDIQAAVQVAHAISTNALTPEFDYFTAVDDISGKSGAGMIGDVAYNSSTYYKYINIHWEQLLNNLGGDAAIARRAVLALVEAAALAQPTGKQNSFAALNLPDFVLVEVGERNLPVSYANAFLKPVRMAGDLTLMDQSVERLGTYLQRVSESYNLTFSRGYLSVEPRAFEVAEKKNSLMDLKNWLGERLPKEA